MRQLLFGLVGLVGLVGCLKSATIACGDRVCPGGTVCESQTLTCLTAEAETVCNVEGIVDGEVCSGVNFVGVCQRQLCLPGCGDGAIEQGTEECDDGNFRSHDGCSSSCSVEKASWKQMLDPWSGVMGHVAGYHEGNNFTMLVTGQSQTALRTQALVARYDSTGWQDQTTTPMPSARIGATMAYDRVRQKLVLFGGTTGAMLYNDTWEWSYMTGWVKAAPSASPPARSGGGMVFDDNPGRIVLFGGTGAAGELDDTWEYNGATWTQITANPRPSRRFGHAMAYDPNRDRTVLYGGNSNAVGFMQDVWEYNAGTWTSIGDGTPGKRYGAVMAYAPDRGTLVLFGGVFEPLAGGNRVPTNDTWSYNGSSWSQIQSMLTPPARSVASLTAVPPPTDAGTSSYQLILLGGAQGGGNPPLADVWRLGLNGWIDISPHGLPPARFGAPMVYDDARSSLVTWGGYGASISDAAWSYDDTWHLLPALDRVTQARYYAVGAYDPERNRIVSFGGYNHLFTDRNETFENSFQSPSEPWVQVSSASSPTARHSGVLAFDGDVLVLFGGVSASGAVLDETWTYDGTTWKQELATTHPYASMQAAAAYDPANNRMVLVDADGATWSHDSRGWTPIVGGIDPTAPPPRDAAALTFDYQTNRMLLAGGHRDQVYYTDVWELDEETWHQVEVVGAGPLPRSYFGFASSALARQTFLVGGAGAALVPFGDVWTLQYRGQFEPEEICDNRDESGTPLDDDGDLHANGDDPDCCVSETPTGCL